MIGFAKASECVGGSVINLLASAVNDCKNGTEALLQLGKFSPC